LDLLHSDQFIDKTPYEVYYELLDQGEYHGSIRTMYRVLDEQGESRDRRIQRNHRDVGYNQAVRASKMGLFSFVRHHGYF